jgi:hypothetical protein
VNAPRLGLPLAFALTAGPTTHCCGPHISLRHFVPPLLLRCGPNLFLAAIFAAERVIHGVAALDELGDTVAIVAPQQ